MRSPITIMIDTDQKTAKYGDEALNGVTVNGNSVAGLSQDEEISLLFDLGSMKGEWSADIDGLDEDGGEFTNCQRQ